MAMRALTMNEIKQMMDQELARVIIKHFNGKAPISAVITMAGLIGTLSGEAAESVEELRTFLGSMHVVMADAAAFTFAKHHPEKGDDNVGLSH